MSDAILGTESGVPVEGVGELFWKEIGRSLHGEMPPMDEDESPIQWETEITKRLLQNTLVIESKYGLPRDHEFSLMLVLDEPFREEGFEYYSVSYYDRMLGEAPEHRVDGVEYKHEEAKFPPWFTTFLDDVCDWVIAQDVSCFDDGPEIGLTHGNIDIQVIQGIPIKNHDVFIGSLAMHLASLKEAFTRT